MELRYAADIVRYKTMTSPELRDSFVVSNLFEPDAVPLTYSDIDRGVVGSAVPTKSALSLPTHKELASDYFCERREVGVINVGGAGTITLDGARHAMARLDSLYVGRGTKDVTFESDDAGAPARYYFVSYPAHAVYPSTHVPQSAANKIELGGGPTSNERVIYQSIRPGIVDTCQVVMGFTMLAEGSVWNTFPPHTHKRRSEFYMYFGMDEETRVLHMMGEADNMRTLVLKNGEVALSPTWSMHCGAGTGQYGFVWSMGGENQVFDDMDHLPIAGLG